MVLRELEKLGGIRKNANPFVNSWFLLLYVTNNSNKCLSISRMSSTLISNYCVGFGSTAQKVLNLCIVCTNKTYFDALESHVNC